MAEELGVQTKRSENFSDWYLEVVRKGDFIDQRSPIKGFDVITPWGYAVWEKIQQHFDSLIKQGGVVNAYFPLFIPENLIKKEEEHFAGFKAETFAVTEAGGEKLEERLFVRPTSETIMYYMYALWIRSHKDLPLRINQWNNVVRFDTKGTKPFIRGREFLWQEAHTAHATQQEADEQVKQAVETYEQSMEKQAIEPLLLVRPKSDTFAGANYSVVMDCLTQDGKVVQGPGTHMLGQNFSKPFNITFLDEKGQQQHVWQTSWGMTTRMIGLNVMQHGDDKGAVLPPEIAPIQVAIVPIMFTGKEDEIKKACESVKENLEKLKLRVHVDYRDYSPGFKFNHWELRGVPVRVEIGPKDVEAGVVTVVKRVDGVKKPIEMAKLREIRKMLKQIQKEMLKKSKKFLRDNTQDARELEKIKNSFGFSRANWCGSAECEKNLKAETGGYEIRGTLYGKKEKPFGPCIQCGKKAEQVVYIAKAY
ncbi:MAG: proline--tRNA ligase [Candidatus Aenigmarchaeota archaeon]|nr:proline--tRNA ligase [Candidatus Aenigmarchaeota archaeon]